MVNHFQMLEMILNETFSLQLLQPSSLFSLLLGAILLVLFYKWSSPRTKSSSLLLPPSPPKLPLIGNLHQLGSLPHRSFQTLAKRYGPDLMLLRFGSKPVLIVSSAEAASEIFKTHDLAFSDRPRFIFFQKVVYNFKDIVAAPHGEYWRQMRSIFVSNLLSGQRVRSFRAVRLEETELMMYNIERSCGGGGTVLNLSEMFMKLTNDVVCRVAMGSKYSDRTDERGRLFMELAAELTDLFTRVNIGDYIPWLAWYTRLSGLDARLEDLAKRVDAFLDIVVQEHMDKPNNANDLYDDDEKDLVDVLLSIRKDNTLDYPVDLVSIKAIILDTFTGGGDTTFTVLEWVMSELLRNPEVMKRLQKEVRGVVGNKEKVTEEDLVEMHYLKAVIKETFRLHPPFSLIFRMCNKDVKIKGYNIEANTQVFINVWALGRDPDSYTNPEQFEPERFLNSTIDYYGTNSEFIPFGSGRRSCPGIHFTMILEEIVLANILHQFDWALPHGMKEADLDMTEVTGSTAYRKYHLKAIATPFKGISK